ncbi:AraC family transcriptional regulator [Burkholderia plantarii]|uniref:AraC family transcriptional regulator n=1 Tax=Burkholderia plantarii TaxID=41899 RepID=UPI000ACFBD43|nr:GyrI-like domain-containing protein [Burkholderia plantarii]
MANRRTEIRQLAPIEVLVIVHVGPYPGIGGAFAQPAARVGARGLFGPHARRLAAFHDNPGTTPADRLRLHACFALGPGTAALDTPPPVTRLTIAGGLHAAHLHQGPYPTLPGAYRRLFQEWLPASGRTLAEAPSFEIDADDPRTTPPGRAADRDARAAALSDARPAPARFDACPRFSACASRNARTSARPGRAARGSVGRPGAGSNRRRAAA